MEPSSLITGSSKTYTHSVGLSCCFRQWRAKSHCNMLHGYALQVEVEFEGVPDNKNWIVDFGSLKPFKAWLEDTFDHRTLVALDDPHIDLYTQMHHLGMINMRPVDATGCEAFSRMIFNWLNAWILGNAEYRGRVEVMKVVVREHEGNSGYTRRPDVR